jgi:hypothetical protein
MMLVDVGIAVMTILVKNDGSFFQPAAAVYAACHLLTMASRALKNGGFDMPSTILRRWTGVNIIAQYHWPKLISSNLA